MIVDVHTPADKKTAVLRIYCIESKAGDDQTELFNNIAMDYTVEPAPAHQLVLKGSGITRDDIRTLLHSPNTVLEHIAVSSELGINQATQQAHGTRYDLSATQLDENPQVADTVAGTLQTTLATLKRSAALESNS